MPELGLPGGKISGSFRMRLTVWFVLLSSVVYICLTGIGYGAFERNLIASTDAELRLLASEFGHAVDLANGKPVFRDWARTLETDPSRGLATIQLYDRDGNLLQKFGPPGVNRLVKVIGAASDNTGKYRVLYTPLTKDGVIVGYLQFQISCATNDNSLKQLFFVLILVGPGIILGLGISSYYVSGLAARPLERNIDSMRRFVADAGHELNTPLSIARAKVESLERKIELTSEDKSEITSVMRSIGRMERIVEDLMYLTELDAQSLTGRLAQVDLSALVSEIVDDFEHRFETKNIALQYVRGESVQVLCDAELIYRAVSNLVENALRYTDAGGGVSLQVSQRASHAIVSIKDSGIGIPATSQDEIFERFHRVDKSRSRESGGVGLGLSIVRAIVRKHGGEVAVQSVPGEGSTFIITLPRAVLH